MAKTVLIAEDESELRDLLASELRDNAIHVVEAANGIEALKLLEKHQIDLVVTDLRMAGGDGLELLAVLRGKPKRIPAILMSGFADCTLSQAQSFGATELLHKPFTLTAFVNIIQGLLNTKGS